MSLSQPAWADCLRHVSQSMDDNWCPFESPLCAGCPNAAAYHHSLGAVEDPLKSVEIKGWLRGLEPFRSAAANRKSAPVRGEVIWLPVGERRNLRSKALRGSYRREPQK